MSSLGNYLKLVPGGRLSGTDGGITAPANLCQCRSLLRSLVASVECCHARGIIHRDIKPSNIVVTSEGELRLIDFDVAAYRGARSTWPGREDVRIGTLPYSAPEQIVEPATATYETADIFSLGVVLYEMLTGRLPFPMTDDEDEEQYRARLPVTDPVPPRAVRPDLSPAIEAVLLKAMQRDPARRHQSAAELRADLEAAFRNGDRRLAWRWSALAAAALVPLAAWIFAGT